MKTIEEALHFFASLIWSNGESKNMGCILPSGYSWCAGEPDKEYTKASDFVYREYEATHFTRKWEKKGKSVALRLFKADGFGAAGSEKLIKIFVIKIGDEN